MSDVRAMRTTMGTALRIGGGQLPSRPPNDTRRHLRRWGRRGITRATSTIAPTLRRSTGYPQSTAPTTTTTSSTISSSGEGATVKFRCERDVLADALDDRRPGGHQPDRRVAGAGRAASRTRRRRAVCHRHRPRPVDPPGGDRRRRQRRRGRRAGAAQSPMPSSRCRRAPSRSTAGDDECQITAGRSQFSLRTLHARRLPGAGRPGRRGGDVVVGRLFAEALRQVVPGSEHRRGPRACSPAC